MATPLKGPLRRELAIGDRAYMLTVTPDGLKLTLKGRRKGHELAWRDLVSGDAALSVALKASLAQSVESAPAGRTKKPRAGKTARRR